MQKLFHFQINRRCWWSPQRFNVVFLICIGLRHVSHMQSVAYCWWRLFPAFTFYNVSYFSAHVFLRSKGAKGEESRPTVTRVKFCDRKPVLHRKHRSFPFVRTRHRACRKLIIVALCRQQLLFYTPPCNRPARSTFYYTMRAVIVQLMQ